MTVEGKKNTVSESFSPQRFSFTASYCVEIILSLTTQGVPDTTTFTEGDGRACVSVCVFRQVSAHMHEYAPSSYVYCPPTSLSLSLYHLFVCLFVSGTFAIVILFPADCSKGSTLLLFPATQTTLHVLSGNTHSAESWFNVNANTNQQTKTKEHNMDPSLSQSHYTRSVCPLFWLKLPLGHIMTTSHFSLKGPWKLSAFGSEKYIFVRFWKRDSLLIL